ncbi:O-antigen ligase family protein [Salinibacter ruber]|uniref:O-antigen ligase family protein n=1 Tax=Salinibacter ruber TaxID=146919 RepID=UPI00160EC001|nr:O-antigen ligase family protein [Salinibacter ruber]MBB4089893.1 O-antigen ligase [Salinibacter ruber]MCS3612976.1 O-antigen ligase [Salinibacter ruber]
MEIWNKKVARVSQIGALFLGGYIVVVPSISLIPSLGPHNEKRALQIGLLFVGGGILLFSGNTRRRWLAIFYGLPTLAQWGFGTVLGLGILSSTLSPAPFYAFLEVGHFVLLFALAGIIASAIRRKPKRAEWFFLGTVGLSALLYAVYFAVRYGGALAFPELEVGRETIGAFANIRFFNQYQTWTLPILVGGAVALPKQWRVAKGIVFALAALWWTLVFGSNVRGTVLAMAVGAIGAWLLFRSRARRWLAVQVASMAAGGVLYFFLFYLGGETVPQVAERLKDVGQGGRPHYWMKCLEMAWMNPWLGVGPMHYAWPPNNFASGAHPHSAFFQWLAEWGVLSTAIMSSLAVWGGWSWMKQERDATVREEDLLPEVGVALVAAALAGASHAMVSGLIVMPVSQVLLAVVGGWAWGRYNRSDKRTGSGLHRWPHHAIFCAAVLSSMLVVGAAAEDLFTVEDRREAFLEAVDRNRLSPRYWTQGYIEIRDSSVIEQVPEEN